MNGSFRRYITHVGRKDGRPYLRTAAEVDSALGEAILEEFDVSPALAAEMLFPPPGAVFRCSGAFWLL